MQIDTSSKPGNNTTNPDVEHLLFQELAQEFMNNDEVVKRIRGIMGRGSRLNVNIDEIRTFNPKLANFVVKHPIEAIKMFEDHLNGQVRTMQEDGNNGKMGGEKQALQQTDAYFPKKILTYHINFEGNFGNNFVTPRGLRANLVNEMVTVQGIVTRMSLVQPKMQTSVHYCEATKRGTIKNYSDENNLGQTSVNGATGSETNNSIPTRDNNDNPYTTEYGYCIYKDSQTVTIQEMPERAPTG
jgi:DNA replication licensing factor MCM3